MASAARTPKGTAMITATIATSTVPMSRPSTPMRAGCTSVRHSMRVRKRNGPDSSRAARLCSRRNSPTRVSRMRTDIPAAMVMRLKLRSARLGSSTTIRGVRVGGAGGTSAAVRLTVPC